MNAKDSDGATVLQYAVANGDPEIVKTLLSASADVNAATDSQVTALMMAASCQSLFCSDLETKVELVQTLLQAKAAINAQDEKGNTALHYAVLPDDNNQVPEHAEYIAKLLLDAGANPKLKNNEGKSAEALIAALKVKKLPQIRPIDPQSKEMMRALLYRDFEKANELLKAGIDVNAQDNFGETLLMKAVVSSFWMGDLNNEGIGVAESLVAAGANVNAADPNGTTPLMLASERLIPNLAESLLKAGADAKMKDREGRTALDRFEQGKTKFFRFTYDRRDVFFKDGTIALTIINHEKLHDLLQAAMK